MLPLGEAAGFARVREEAERRPAMSDRCAVCDSAELEPHLRVAGRAGPHGLIPTTKEFGTALGDIVRCRACGHMQLDRFPSEEKLKEAYAEAASEDYIGEEAGQRETARRVLERIERHVEPGPLVDLGCWVGFLVAEADARGWEAVGVEPSAFASTYARARLGLDVRTDDLFTAALPEHRFHAVVLGDVIEHLTRPDEALARVTVLLARKGVLALMLPDSGSRVARMLGARWWSVIPTHVQYFTRSSIDTLLARHGYRVLYMGTAPKAFTVRYYLAKTAGYSEAFSRGLVRAADAVGVADRMWAPDFRDRMLVIARPAVPGRDA
jgi:SAM-dependent methyltransferase